jgi:aerobic-type carbon monoxide dehydrogenase small subunit (CoxS/CutS family)
MAARKLSLKINGVPQPVRVAPDRSLLSVLRTELNLTGTKYGCGEGACGSCTVLLDGKPHQSCQVPVGEVGRREVTTIEGLARDGHLTPVQRAFAELGAFQCGFCTPGMVVRATALLREHPVPSELEMREALDNNVCRCCGYAGILRAVRRASELAAESSEAP